MKELIYELKTLFFRRKAFCAAVFLSFLVFLVTSLIDEGLYLPDINGQEKDTGKTLQGRILSINPMEYGYSLEIKVFNEGRKALIYVSGSKEVESSNGSYLTLEDLGKECEISLKEGLEYPTSATNPRSFDYKKYLFGKGITYVGYGGRLNWISQDRPLIYMIKTEILKTREFFLSACFTRDESKALAKGILFGDTEDIAEDTYKVFRENGTAHILAVSGLHIGIIYQSYEAVRARIGRKRRCIKGLFTVIFILFLLLYGTATLWSPSVTRAIFLVYLKIIGDKLDRRYDILSAVSVINLIMVLMRPYYVYSVSFQLSFLSAYGISVIIPRLRGRIPNALCLPLGLQFFLLPYMIREFNYFNISSVVINIIIVYLVSIYVPIGIIIYLVTVILMYAGGLDIIHSLGFIELLGTPISSLGMLINKLEEWFDIYGSLGITLTSPGLFTVVLLMLLVLFIFSETFLVLMERKDLKGIGLVLILIILTAGFFGISDRSPFDEASQIFIDVGQGDSLHLSWDEDRDILIDGGGRKDFSVGEKVLKPYLLRNGTRDLDLAITTHHHMDHYKGIEELNLCYPIKKILEQGIKGDIIRLSKDRYIKVLWPLKENIKSHDENYFSRVFMVYDKGIRTLVTGDITEEGENALIKEYKNTDELKCHILKVAHHGSRFSSCEDFLEITEPQVAVISVGRRNNYGHPSPEVIEKINDLGIIIYRTDLDGAVGIIVGHREFQVVTQLTKKRDYYQRG